MAQQFIGVSGWRYTPWRGSFYPRGLSQGSELYFASRRFNSLELNASFYGHQKPETYRQWAQETPADFVFSVKAPREITHDLRLRHVKTALGQFFGSGLLSLGPKLGTILWQLPSSLHFDPQLLRDFLEQLPWDSAQAEALARQANAWRPESGFPGPVRRLRHALEVRHRSFENPLLPALLRSHNVALVVSDNPGRWPRIEDICADFMYLRLHGHERLVVSGYDDERLDDWAGRIRTWAAGGEPVDSRLVSGILPSLRDERDVYCYFDNTGGKLRAPGDAMTLALKLALPSRPVDLGPLFHRDAQPAELSRHS